MLLISFQRKKMKKMFTSVLSVLVTSSITLLAGGHQGHWGYTGHEGPDSWGSLSEKHTMCSKGKNQSPINITSSFEADLDPLNFHYTTSQVKILNNGHTVQVNIKKGSYLQLAESRYELIQYHFHTPSENNIHGKVFPLEAHFVHADKDGNLAVIGVMFEEGKENKQLSELWKKMPMKSGENYPLTSQAKNINKLLPDNKEYYRFNGSLTTPPCSEGVKWMVLSTPLTISKEQVEKFSHAVHGFNNRPIQDLNARVILK